ncbi:hypothetical protein O0L34_g10154 [Tuta absoluta]|nr:hypothetical protein O0L34_g10154 [Tuta absoluta]
MVTDGNVFPYVAAILKKSTYISSGALISDSWILTGGDALYLLRETAREIRVRLGSINYRKGGVLLPIKQFEVHPYFRDTLPEYDIALMKLPEPVRFTPSLYPIRVQSKPKIITTTHFIVTSWPVSWQKEAEPLKKVESMETIKRRRILTVSHLHPTDFDVCLDEMNGLDISNTAALMCLDLPVDSEPCARDIGAPVVLNGVLWGIISSYKPEDCKEVRSPSFVTLVSAPDISSWIHAAVSGHRWNMSPNTVVVKEMMKREDKDDEYSDNENQDYNDNAI